MQTTLYMHKNADRSLKKNTEIYTYIHSSSFILLAEGMSIPFV